MKLGRFSAKIIVDSSLIIVMILKAARTFWSSWTSIPISDNDNLFKCTFMIFSCESESLSQCWEVLHSPFRTSANMAYMSDTRRHRAAGTSGHRRWPPAWTDSSSRTRRDHGTIDNCLRCKFWNVYWCDLLWFIYQKTFKIFVTDNGI